MGKLTALGIFLFGLLQNVNAESPAPTTKATTPAEALAAWGRVLATYVDDEGRVNFQGVMKDRADLQLYVDFIAKNGPKTTPAAFPDQPSKMAHYLNSYNALSMHNVLEYEIPKALVGLKKVRFFYFAKFLIDGDEMSLYKYENEIIRKQGDERVHFALNCMSRGCPRLPKVPFAVKTLNEELEREANRFFNESRNVYVKSEDKEVYLSEILKFFTEDFTPTKAPSLIAYANKYRKEKLDEKFEVEFIPYDWTVNVQPSAAK